MTDPLLVRTWNIAHGRDVPPGPGYGHARRKLLGEMADLITADRPDVVMLQEVPVWAASLLRERTGMGVTLAHTYGAHIPFVHIPLPLALGEWLGNALPDMVKTQFEGQAQAVLYGPELVLVSARRVQVNSRRHLRGEPRVAQLVRLRHRRDGAEFAVGNLHADAHDADPQIEAGSWALEQFARGCADGVRGRSQRARGISGAATAECPRVARRAGRRGCRPSVRARFDLVRTGHPLAPTAAGSAAQRRPAAAAFRSQPSRRDGGVRCLISCPPWRVSRSSTQAPVGRCPRLRSKPCEQKPSFRWETRASAGRCSSGCWRDVSRHERRRPVRWELAPRMWRSPTRRRRELPRLWGRSTGRQVIGW